MNYLKQVAQKYSARARKKRAQTFRQLFPLTPQTKILDLGSESGAHIHAVLAGTPVLPKNVFIADINPTALAKGHRRYGFTPVLIDKSGQLPFEDQAFDVVYCSSVIEHVTVDKEEVWGLRSGKAFKRKAFRRQKAFAREIERVGRCYFVQTPYRYFPVESHSWLPFVAWLPRHALMTCLRRVNQFWIKKTHPDWHLLSQTDMHELFHDARILHERSLGMIKSLMAVRNA